MSKKLPALPSPTAEMLRHAKGTHQPMAIAPVQVPLPIDDGTVLLSMIQALIPLGLKAVEEALQRDVIALAGARALPNSWISESLFSIKSPQACQRR